MRNRHKHEHKCSTKMDTRNMNTIEKLTKMDARQTRKGTPHIDSEMVIRLRKRRKSVLCPKTKVLNPIEKNHLFLR